MDKLRLKQVAEQLLREVESAKANGYENADALLTSEVLQLMPLIMSLEISQPVELRFTAGSARLFSETSLHECHALEHAWATFRIEIEGEREFAEGLFKELGWRT